MILGHHIDAPRNILYSCIGCESRSLFHQFLCRFRCHPFRQLHQHMSTTTNRFFYKQDREGGSKFHSRRSVAYPLPFTFHYSLFTLQKSKLLHNFIRVSLLVKVQHQSIEWTYGIRNGSMVILKLRAMRCPHRQTMLQLIVTFLYTCTHLCQPRFAAKILPIILRCREARSAVPLADTCEFHGPDYC